MWRPRAPAWSRPKPPAEFIQPAQAVLYPVAPTGPEWIHEIKADGYRLVARKDGDSVRLWTRQAIDYTAHFPGIASAVGSLPVRSCMIDGEAVCFGDACHDFHALRARAGGGAATLYAFDLLMLDGDDLRAMTLEKRRASLERLLRNAPDGLMFSAAIQGDGPAVFEQACRMGLEGIVSKRLGSRYRSGKCEDWRKIKNKDYTRA